MALLPDTSQDTLAATDNIDRTLLTANVQNETAIDAPLSQKPTNKH